MNQQAVVAERVLVVDDEPDIVALVAYHLAKSGYKVSTAASGQEAIDQARAEKPAAVILDLMLPDMSGFDVLSKLRDDESTRNVAVLMLTARRDEPDRIRGLSLGADDYLTKPFSPQELVLRINAILRRLSAGKGAASEVLKIGALRIDKSAHRVTVGDQDIDLTATEFKLLLLLAERRGRVQARSHLLQLVWEAAPDIQTRTVDMHVQRLRAKLGAAGELIETVRGFGYRINSGHPRGA
ncbi:MAG: response regulator transcription factor [Gemmatimonadaceae bacterium]|nr:response regulator transcription factor [Gemmatimonadaceae bacterium]